MTTEEKRIKIAEHCGWTFHPPSYNVPPFTDSFKAEALLCWVRPGSMAHQTELPPDYFNDLNAMHDAEKSLTLSQIKTYGQILSEFTDESDQVTWTRQWHAAAPQRAEAFGLTLGLW